MQCAIVTIAVEGLDAVDLVKFMRARDINVVSSHREFAVLDFCDKKVETAVRLSPHYYNTEQEIAAAVEAIQEGIVALRR